MNAADYPDDLKPATWERKKGSLPPSNDVAARLKALQRKHDGISWKLFDDAWTKGLKTEDELDEAFALRDRTWRSSVFALKKDANDVAAAAQKMAKEKGAAKPTLDAAKAIAAAAAALVKAIDDGVGELKAASDKAAKALPKPAAPQDDEPVSALLEPKKLLVQLNLCKADKDRKVQFGFVEGKDKDPAVFALSPKIAGKKLLTQLQDATGLKTGTYGTAWVDGHTLYLQSEKHFGGLEKKVRPPIKDCGFHVTEVVLADKDGADDAKADASSAAAAAARPAASDAADKAAAPAKADSPAKPEVDDTADEVAVSAKPAAKPAADATAPDEDEDEGEPLSQLRDPAQLLQVLVRCRRDPRVRVQFAFVDGHDSEPATLVMSLKQKATKLFTRLRTETGVKTGSYGTAWVADATTLYLQVDKPFSGLAKKARLPAIACGFRVTKVVLWDADGTELEAEAEAAVTLVPEAVYTQTRQVWEATRGKVTSEMRKLEDAILAAYAGRPGLPAVAQSVRQFDRVLDVFDESLLGHLDQAVASTDPTERARWHAEARNDIERYRANLQRDALVRELDANPFVPVAVQATLARTLDTLAAKIG